MGRRRGSGLLVAAVGGSALIFWCAVGGNNPGGESSARPDRFAPDPEHLVWDDYGGGADASKYVAHTQVTKENVRRLQLAWTYETADNISYPFNPIVVDGVMYVLAKNNSLGRGMVFVISNDGPSFYEPMERRTAPDPDAPAPTQEDEAGGGAPRGGPGGRGGANAAALAAQGQALYAQQCQVCHLANRMGQGAAPSLAGLENRLSGADFLALLRSGRGEMPAFGHLSEESIHALYRYLGGSADGGILPVPDGPVIASGGAPGGLFPRQLLGGVGGGRGRYGIPYPEGSDAPEVRYFIRGYGMEYSAIGPPWSSITAYDLAIMSCSPCPSEPARPR